MIFFLDVDCPANYADLTSAFVELKGSLVPVFFHIENINGNKAIVSFEDLEPEQVLKLLGCNLFLPLSLLPKLTGNQFYFHEVKGFRAVDETYGDIGVIRTIIEYPAQPLFQIINNDKEILIPVIDPVIKKVDREHQTIYIAAPEGLIDLYLKG